MGDNWTVQSVVHVCYVLLTEIIWNELFTVVHDEDSAHIELDVVSLLLVFKEVKCSSSGNEKQGPELQLTFH